MASRFLLPCPCGQTHTIARTQAGHPLTCKCGAKLEVPTIREMEKLERLVESSEPSVWSARQGVLFVAGLLVLIVGAAATTWLIRQTPAIDLDDPQLLADWNLRSGNLLVLSNQDSTSIARVAARWHRDLDQLTAAQSLGLWSLYRDLQPLVLRTAMVHRARVGQRARYRRWTWATACLTAICATGLIGTALIGRR